VSYIYDRWLDEDYLRQRDFSPILPTGTCFTRKWKANARAGLRYRDRLRGSEVKNDAAN
jgi:hypothetical protein